MEDTDMNWRTASYSSNGGGNCIEVGQAPGLVAVRDSQDQDGPNLAFGRAAWAMFLADLKN